MAGIGDILGGLGGIGGGYLRGTNQLQEIQSQQYAQALRALALQQQMKQQQSAGNDFRTLLGGGLDNPMGGGGQMPSMAPGQAQQQPLPQQTDAGGLAPGFARGTSGLLTQNGQPPDRYGPDPTTGQNVPMWNAGGGLPGIIAQLESGGGRDNASQPPSMVDPTYGQYPGFASQYGKGAAGVNNFAQAELAAKPDATLGDYYSDYVLGTGKPGSHTTADLASTSVPGAQGAFRNLTNNAGVPASTPLTALLADFKSSIPPQIRNEGLSGARNVLQGSGNPLTLVGRLDPTTLAQAIKKANPDASDEVNMASFDHLFPLLSNAGKAEFAQQWEAYKFGVQQTERAGEFKQRQESLDQNRAMMQGFAQQRIDQTAGKGEGQGFQFLQTPQGIVRANPRTGQVEPAGLPEGTTKFGGAGQQKWSEDAINALIEQGMAGDASLMAKLPRSGPARQQYEEGLAKRLNESPGGLTGGVAQMQMNQMRMAEAKAAAQTAGRVTINSEVYQAEAQGAGQMVVDASKAVPRTEMKPINQIMNAYYTNSGDPNIIRLGQALVALYNAYGKMSNPTGTGVHDADKARIEQTLNAALSQGQVEAGVDQIIKEGANLMGAAYKAQTDVLKNVMPLGGSLPPQSATPSGTDYSKMTNQQLIDLSKQQGQ